jgi:hypothetical protein
MKADNLFLSNIVRPGIMFRVIKPTKDNVFGIGTTGFIGYVKGQDQDFPNVVFYEVIITRRGKSGKARLDPGEISTPIFFPKYKNLETVFPEIDRKHFIFIDTSTDLISKDILEFDNHQFLGWATSWGYFLNKLNTMVRKIKVWPNDLEHVLNIIRDLPHRFMEDPIYTLENYTSQKFRIAVVTEIRRFESALSRCAIKYLYKITCIEQKAIINLHKNAKDLKLDEEQLKKVNTLITNKMTRLETIMLLK